MTHLVSARVATVVLFLGSVAVDQAVGNPPPVLVGGTGLDRGVHLAATADGYVITGFTDGGEGRGDDILLLSVDPQGVVRWQRSYGGPARDWGWYVTETGDGFAVIGTTASFGAGEHDCVVIRADRSGAELSRRTYGGTGDEYCWSAVPTPEDGFLLVGDSTTGSAGKRDLYLARVDSAGDLLWQLRFGGPGEDRLFSVTNADDGGFVAVGATTSEGSGETDVLLVGISEDGRMLWKQVTGGAGIDIGHSVTRLAGGYVVTGYTENFGADLHDAQMLWVDEGGGLLSRRVYGSPGIDHAITGCALEGGGFVLTGFSKSDRDASAALLVLTVAASGELLSRRQLELGGDAMGYTVVPARAGGAAITGHAFTQDYGAQLVFMAVPALPDATTAPPDE